MNVLIAGSRPKYHKVAGQETGVLTPGTLKRHKAVYRYVDSLPVSTVIVCGMAPGVDMAAFERASYRGMKVLEYRARWKSDGKAAGPLRNRRMAKVADRAVLFWDGKSPGTNDMKAAMEELGKPVEMRIFPEESTI